MVVLPVMGPSCCIVSNWHVICDAWPEIDASAFDVMADVPWSAACREDRHKGRRGGGMMIRSL